MRGATPPLSYHRTHAVRVCLQQWPRREGGEWGPGSLVVVLACGRRLLSVRAHPLYKPERYRPASPRPLQFKGVAYAPWWWWLAGPVTRTLFRGLIRPVPHPVLPLVNFAAVSTVSRYRKQPRLYIPPTPRLGTARVIMARRYGTTASSLSPARYCRCLESSACWGRCAPAVVSSVELLCRLLRVSPVHARATPACHPSGVNE